MACEYCGYTFGHNFRCPDYKEPRASHYCYFCEEGITDGEEYVTNENNEYAHYECLDSVREVLDFFGYEIKRME